MSYPGEHHHSLATHAGICQRHHGGMVVRSKIGPLGGMGNDRISRSMAVATDEDGVSVLAVMMPSRKPYNGGMDTPMESIEEAVGRGPSRRVLAEADADIAARKPVCRASGRCCQFEKYGHRLYVTTAEVMHFEAKTNNERLPPL